MHYLLNTVNEWKQSSQAETIFIWSAMKYVISHYPGGMSCHFSWLILTTLYWFLVSVGLIDSSTCLNHSSQLSGRSSCKTISFNFIIYTVSHSLDKDQTLVMLVVLYFVFSILLCLIAHYNLLLKQDIFITFKFQPQVEMCSISICFFPAEATHRWVT